MSSRRSSLSSTGLAGKKPRSKSSQAKSRLLTLDTSTPRPGAHNIRRVVPQLTVATKDIKDMEVFPPGQENKGIDTTPRTPTPKSSSAAALAFGPAPSSSFKLGELVDGSAVVVCTKCKGSYTPDGDVHMCPNN